MPEPVSAIASDLDERPELTPWIAALWIEPSFRKTGIARRLLERTVATLFEQGCPQVYLCAAPRLRDFYLGLGCGLLEAEFGKDGVDIFVRQRPFAGLAEA